MSNGSESYSVTLTFDEWVTVIALIDVHASRDSNPAEYLALDIKIRRELGITA